LGQRIYFSFSTHKQCIFSRYCTIALLCNPYKTLNPGWIRTRVFCSWGGFGVDSATPPGFIIRVKCTGKQEFTLLAFYICMKCIPYLPATWLYLCAYIQYKCTCLVESLRTYT
jgi:hypothetical protein